ncbi:MAG: hypothetical protein H7232_04715 [Aeromicrobium sp.]|nr:hypothetical protein [Burkholderiales bacterium]
MRVSKNQVTLLAAAVASLFAMSANAQVNLNSAGGVTGSYTPGKAIPFASELTITPTTGIPLTGPVNGFDIGSVGAGGAFVVANGAVTQAALDVITGVPLGVGIVGGQKRFIRLDLSGGARFGTGLGNLVSTANIAATLSVAAGGQGGTITAGGTGTGQFAGITIALGGVGSSFVVYEVTAGAAGNVQNDIFQVDIPVVNMTSNTNAVGITYSIFEFLTGASQASGAVFTRTTPLFAPVRATRFGLSAPGGGTAVAANGFRDFGANSFRVNLGAVALSRTASYSTNVYTSADALDAAGVAITSAAQVVNTGAAGSMALAGDFSAAAAPSSVYSMQRGTGTGTCLPDPSNNINPLDVATAVSATGATVPLVPTSMALLVSNTALADLLNAPGGVRYCYLVNGAVALGSPVQGYTATLTATPLANFTLPAYVATLGSIGRDGVALESPWVTSTPGFISRFFLTDTRTPAVAPATPLVATAWTAVVRNASGVVTGGTLTGNVAASTVARVDLTTLLPADTTASPGPYQVTFTVGGTGTPALQITYVLTSPNGSVTTMPTYRLGAR